MTDPINLILDIMAQFAGGRGEAANHLVRFGLAGINWAILFFIALNRWRHQAKPHERLLAWGFGLGLAREVIMFMVFAMGMGGYISNEALHPLFPPLEHALAMASVVVVAGAFLRLILNDVLLSRYYTGISLALTIVCYLVVFLPWTWFLAADPSRRFGMFWGDWLFHSVSAALIAIPMVLLISRVNWMKRMVVLALFMFFMDDFLMLFNLAGNEVHADIYTPIRHTLHMAAIPILGYVYIKEQLIERRKAEEALRESESRYNYLYNNLSDAAFIISMQGRLLDVNDVAVKRLGYSREHIMLMHVSEFNESRFARGVAERMQQIGRKKHSSFETVHVTSDGRHIPTEINAALIEFDGQKAVMAIARDITQRKDLEMAILDIEDREKQRIGHDLHDSVGQTLTGVSFRVQSLESELRQRGAPEAEAAAIISSLLNETKKQVRMLAKGISPVILDTGGITSALEELVEGTAELFSANCMMVCEHPVSIYYRPAALQLYRIAQEAVTNAVRHGRAGTIEVCIGKQDDEVTMVVRDDGRGIDESRYDGGMGLNIMNYRALMIGGRLEIHSKKDLGTTVICVFPDVRDNGEPVSGLADLVKNDRGGTGE